MAGTPLAEAFVRVRALTDKFRDDVKDGFKGVGDDFGRQFTKDASARIRAEQAAFETEGEQIGDKAGAAAGREFADGMKDNGVKFGDDASPFVAVGKKLGAQVGQAAGAEFAKAMGKQAGEGFTGAIDPLAKFKLQLAQAELAARRTGLAAKESGERAVEAAKAAAAAAEQVTKGEKEREEASRAAAEAAAELAEQVVKGEVSKEEAAKRSAKAAAAAAELVKRGEKEKADAVRLATQATTAQEKAEIAATNAQLAKVTVSQRAAAISQAYAKAQADAASETDKLGNATKKANADLDRSSGLMSGLAGAARVMSGAFTSAASSLSLVGAGAAGVAGLGAAAASATGVVVTLAAELAPLSGLLAALPGVALTGAAAFSVWKLATAGLGEAMSAQLSGNTEALSAAMGKLTETGRGFVRELGLLLPQINQFKGLAQEPFLEPLIGQMGRWLTDARALGPAIGELAGQLGGIVRQVLDFATSAGTLASFNTVLGDTSTLMGALRVALDPLLKGFVDLGVVGSSWMAGMSSGLTDVLTKFGQWMTKIAENGQAWKWMDAGLAVLKQLGTLAKDLTGILNGLFGAAREAGAGALGVISQLVSTFNQWVNSAQGQQVLVTVFRALDQVGRALTPVIVSLGGAIAVIAPEAAKVATALGPVLAGAIDVLGRGIAAMGPGLVKMVEGFGRMVAAVGPLEPLGAAIGDIFAALGEAFALIVPELAQIALALAPALAAAIRGLAPALAALGPGLTAVAGYLAKAFADPALQAGLLALGKGLADVLIAAAPLLPVIAQLAGILAQVLGQALTNIGSGLGPIIKALAEALAPALLAVSRALEAMLPHMGPIYAAFGEIGATLITELLPAFINLLPVMIDSLIPAFLELAREITPLIPLLTQLAVKFIKEMLPAIIPILPYLTDIALGMTRMGLVLLDLVNRAGPWIDKIIGFFQRLYDTLVGNSIIPDLINGIRDWFQRGIDWVIGIVEGISKIPQIISAWLGVAVEWVQRKWNEIKNAIEAKINEIRNKISEVLDTIRERWNSIWEGVKNYVSDKWNEIKNAVSGKINDLLNNVRDIPGRITGALGNLGSLLWNSGRSIVQGLIDGLWSKLQDAANAASDIMNRIRDFFPFSPAKEGPFSGRGWVTYSGASMMTGLAEGIRAQQGAVTGALDGVLRSGAATLGAGLQVPVSGMGGTSAVQDFAGSFGAPVGSSPVAAAGQRTFVIENLNVQGVLDPSSPVSYRRMVERLREAIIELESEGYANA